MKKTRRFRDKGSEGLGDLGEVVEEVVVVEVSL